jgi:hypothetical protein
MGKRKIIISYRKLGEKDLLQEKGNKKDMELQCKDPPSLCLIEEAVRERSSGISFYTETSVKRSSCFL